MFAGISTNEGDSDFLDIYLEGQARAWVAVGFTDSPSMVKGLCFVNSFAIYARANVCVRGVHMYVLTQFRVKRRC